MKELSIEEKAKRYDEAIEKATIALKDEDRHLKATLERIFPSLKENEDYRIRKALIEHFNFSDKNVYYEINGIPHKKVIAWLEKQGGQKIQRCGVSCFTDIVQAIRTIYNEESTHDLIEYLTDLVNRKEQKSADKVEPKFHKSDWVVTNYGKVNQVVSVDKDGNGYTLDDGVYFSGSWCDMYHLWTIEDAKDGDVLANKHGCPLIFKDKETCWCYYSISNEVFRPNSNKWFFSSEDYLCPSNKEQRNILMKAMADAGYTFDFEKKELKKIEPKPADEEMKELLRTEYEKGRADAIAEMQKPWSEEDEEVHRKCICAMRASACGFPEEEKFVEQVDNWLKSLKDRVQPKIEWSEEDDAKLKSVLFHIEDVENKDVINWLKSLKNRVLPQSRQEWSEDDENRINRLIAYFEDKESFTAEDDIVYANWLKSLKDRYTWKPSDSQMGALWDSIKHNLHLHPVLESLYNDLKKLKG